MATSPSPDSQPSAVPPPPRLSTPATLPPWLSTRFSTPPSPPPEENSPSIMSNSSVSPSANSTAPPQSTESPPAPAQPPVASPPPLATPSPPPESSSPAPESAPPPAPVSPPPIPSPTTNSPPPPPSPSPSPPVNPQPTPTHSPSADSPPSPSSKPPSVSPPPRTDPQQSSPRPSPAPSQNPLPSPSSQPPQTTTPPADSPPQDSPPAPSSAPPTNATPLSTFNPPPPLAPNSQPSPNSSARPVFPVSAPPPSGLSPPSFVPPSPSQVQVPPSGIPTVNNSIPNAPSGNGGIGTGVAVAVGAVLGFILLSVIGAAVWYTRKQKKKVSGMPTSLTSSPNTDSSLLKGHRSPIDVVESRTPSEYLFSPSTPGGLGNSRPWFTYEALVGATNGFSAENLLGEGGFGSVYKGYLPDGQEVAVKQLKIGGGQGEREFKAEVEIISRIHHRHLVSLAGYCISDNRRLLVYEFVPNNTLHFHLHEADRQVMTWETRVRVAAGAARGIAYLHEDCHPRIIHRDIKSANILLDNNFEARVSDFGLAKLAVEANSHVTTRVMGTFGYMAPEYASSGKLTEKSDVFSFGVVLLELITGRKPVDMSLPLGEESLVEWARPQLSHALATKQFEDLIDPRLEKNYVNSEMFRVIEAAAACVRHSATKRPSMGQVVRAFDSLITADLSNGMRVGESAIYDSAEQSAEIRLFQRMAFGAQDYSSDFFSHGSWHS